MALKDNWYYYEVSLKNPEPLIDENYISDTVSVRDEEFIRKVERLRDLITAYCVMVEKDSDAAAKILDEIYGIITGVGNIQYTEFVAFWKVLDLSYSLFRKLSDRKGMLEALVREYCGRRRSLYDRMGYSNVVVQALYDSGVSRKKGQVGTNKLLSLILRTLGKVPHIMDITSPMASPTGYFLPDGGDENTFEEFRKALGIRYEFGRGHQGKEPDLVLKSGKHFFIIEAKHVKEAGGAQDKQVLEVIEFIRYSEDRDDVHYVSFMDGLYFNNFILHKDDNSKPGRQRRDIERYLKGNKGNFFVNTAGFEALLEDLREMLTSKI